MTLFRRICALALCLSLVTVPLRAAPAQPDPLVTTTEAISSGRARDQVRDLLARDEVRAALAEHGVTPAQVQARVDALTDEEAAALAERMAQMPAGGDVLGILFTVFVILLVTDILCLTKVFPFTRCVR